MPNKSRKIVGTYEDRFLEMLRKLSAATGKPVSNEILRIELRWEVDRYEKIKDLLKKSMQIKTGRGGPGTVMVTDDIGNKQKALKLFISYCHADEEYKTELIKHLEPLKKLNLIDTWHDRKITAGSNIDHAINAHLKVADIVLLLISIDFINSNYCYDTELALALERHKNKEARIIPIILRDCMWNLTPITNLLALPNDAKPVSSFGNRDEAYVQIANGILKVATEQKKAVLVV